MKKYKVFKEGLENGKKVYRVGDVLAVSTYQSKSEDYFLTSLKECIDKYPDIDNNLYYEIEIIANPGKGYIAFNLSREVTKEELIQVKEKLFANKFSLNFIDQLKKAINCTIGGSTALMFHGINLSRECGDLDIILPYYQSINKTVLNTHFDSSKITVKSILKINTGSGSDFKNQYSVTYRDNQNSSTKTIKIDVRVDPYQDYEYVEYGENLYKIAKVIDILEAKIRYAKSGNGKHEMDIKRMLGLK